MPVGKPRQESLRIHARTSLTFFTGTLLPLAIFMYIAQEVFISDGFPFEPWLDQELRGIRTPALDYLARALDVVGGTWVMLIVGAGLVTLLYRVHHRLAWVMFSALLGAALLGTALRQVLYRPRPQPPVLLTEPGGSFPSGHVMVAVALVVVLSAVLWSTRARLPVLVLGITYVLLMMWARVYAGVHHTSDVVAAVVLALAWSVALVRATHVHQVVHRP